MKKLLLAIVALMFFTLFGQSYAQNKWIIELRYSVDLTTKDIADAELDIGSSAELTIAYRFIPHLTAYAGWSYNNFASLSILCRNRCKF